MASLLWTVLLVCLAAPCVKADDKNLGEDCTAGNDTCTDTGATCENSVCGLKVDETCTNNTDCITNAGCTGSSGTKCACSTGYTANNAKDTCAKKSDSAAVGLVGSLVTVTLAVILPIYMRHWFLTTLH